jgi:hypothetical protein
MGAMYIVMGAFGHGRVAEAIFGGVTQHAPQERSPSLVG